MKTPIQVRAQIDQPLFCVCIYVCARLYAYVYTRVCVNEIHVLHEAGRSMEKKDTHINTRA